MANITLRPLYLGKALPGLVPGPVWTIRRKEISLVPENIWTSDPPASSLVGLNDSDKQKFSSSLFASCYSLGRYSNKEPKALPHHVTSQCSQLQPRNRAWGLFSVVICRCSASVFVVEYSALFLAVRKVCNLSSQALTLGCAKWRNIWRLWSREIQSIICQLLQEAHQLLERHVFISVLSIIMICDCNVFYDVPWTSRQVFNEAQSSFCLTHWGRGHLNCLNARSRGF